MPGIDPSELERIDAALKVQLDILRTSATVEAEILRLLEQMRKDLIAKLAAADLTTWGKARINAMLKDAAETINAYYARAQGVLAPTYATVAGVSAAQTATALAVTAPSRAVLESLVSSMLVEGAPMKAWWAKQSVDTAFKFSAAVRQGIAQSETLNQIFKRVNDATDLANRNSIALVHTSVMQVMNDANVSVIEQNADVAPTMRYLATLDSSTCWSAETLILMADGTHKPACDIAVGDMVIGGVTGKPHQVIATMQKEVVSSVAIHYNGKIIGRVTHDHPVLTESGWKEIGSVSLSADISEREVLCRSFRSTGETLHGASEICGGRRGICTTQRDTEAWRTGNDNPCIESDTAGSVPNGSTPNQGTQYEGSERVQHDERRGGSRGHCAGNIEGDGESALEAHQRGCRIQRTDAGGDIAHRPPPRNQAEGVLGVTRGDGSATRTVEFGMEGQRDCAQQAPAHPRDVGKIPCSEEVQLGDSSTARKDECCEGSEASRIACDESRMGCGAGGENGGYHESKMGRPRISSEDGDAEAACAICGITRTGGEESPRYYDDTRKAGGDIGETSPVVGETEGVKVGTITGVVENTPIEVFNFTVADDHSYVAGGIIVHNCTRCAPRDGLEWDTRTHAPIGHTLEYAAPPIHFSCRCRMSPVTFLSKEMDKLGIGQRASMFGPVKASTTFGEFLKRQTPEWQDSVLGKGKAELFRQGKITLRDTISGRGSPLSLAALQKKYDH